MVNSIKKGKRGEREVVKLLKDWWGGDFSRSPDSGAFMTTHAQVLVDSGSDLGGDIITPPDFPFSVEVKLRKEIDLWELVRIETPTEDQALMKDNPITWWYQAKYDASRFGKIPFVIMKENRKQWYCILPYEFKKFHNNDIPCLVYKEMFYICTYKNVKTYTKEEILACVELYRKDTNHGKLV